MMICDGPLPCGGHWVVLLESQGPKSPLMPQEVDEETGVEQRPLTCHGREEVAHIIGA